MDYVTYMPTFPFFFPSVCICVSVYDRKVTCLTAKRSKDLTQAAQHQENQTHGSPYITKLRSVSGMTAAMQSHKAAQCL